MQSEAIRVRCDNIGMRGEGVARHQGMPLFVPGILPGEEALVALSEQRATFARAELRELLEESPQRRSSFCPYFPACGGCQLQHWDYQAQLAWKRRQVEELFRRQAGLDVQVLPPLTAATQAVRNKVQLPVQADAGGDRQLQIGFFRSRSHRVVDLDSCPMQSPLANRALRILRSLLAEFDITAYDEQKQQGLLRHILLRTDRDDTALMIVLVLNGEALPGQERLAQALQAALPELRGLSININRKPGNTILGPETRLIWGSEYLVDAIGDLRFQVSASSFFQTNRYLTETLYEVALQQARLTGTELVLEAYCGTGTISAFLARKAAKVIGVEINAQAVADAGRNAELNGLKNLSFHQGASELVLPELLRQGVRPDLVLVDPPRQGCAVPLLEAIAEASVPRLVYISCNPATLVRDAAWLVERGYRLGEIQPVDMFPWTEHLECCCTLTRVSGRSTSTSNRSEVTTISRMTIG